MSSVVPGSRLTRTCDPNSPPSSPHATQRARGPCLSSTRFRSRPTARSSPDSSTTAPPRSLTCARPRRRWPRDHRGHPHVTAEDPDSRDPRAAAWPAGWHEQRAGRGVRCARAPLQSVEVPAARRVERAAPFRAHRRLPRARLGVAVRAAGPWNPRARRQMGIMRTPAAFRRAPLTMPRTLYSPHPSSAA